MSLFLVGHASTPDKFKLITSAAGDIDTFISYIDYTDADPPVVVDMGNEPHTITTAATTDILAGNTNAAQRRVPKQISIVNASASVTNDVTMVVDAIDGNDYQITEKVTLQPGESFKYDEGLGWFKSGAVLVPSIFNVSTADQVTSTSDVYLLNSNLLIGGRIKVGTMFRWKIAMTKTAAGTANPIFIVRFGTAGTIADTVRNTLTTTVAGSAAVDTGIWEVYGVVRTHSATGVVHAACGLSHALDSTGFVGGNGAAQQTSATFDTTVAGLQVGLSYNGGSSAAHTVQQVQAEAMNLAA